MLLSMVFTVTLSSDRFIASFLFQLHDNQLQVVPAEIGQLTNLQVLAVRCHKESDVHGVRCDAIV